ncbi:unnamed protein product [Rotaria sordida]|uniref:Thioredoxin domain-containing protein n=1 Tax=Rotaria sordida TaxID=392033 RepID=A0A816D5A3_9BILA|nr:unnamed protein product [Rotaria sordida]CAF1415396.1 unnamed protein product [Rotaria sordida]CAF1628640.1 unnamed protein product [Rotaria sordida]CAF1628705.1 unnamed protein product [Rotaria sordida]
MAGVAKLFDDHILDKSKELVDLNDEEYKGKVIGLYFSAHWCGPCRRFTPKLIEFYNSHAKDKNFEIIFISSDNDEESFNEYYEHMPWFTLDFKESDKKAEIENKFDITGIPTLILLDGDSGDIICTDADERVSSDDSEGEKFPWKSS